MSVTPIRQPDADPVLPERLAQRLQDPQVVEALDTILAHADLLALLVEGASGLAERGETLTDTLVEGLRELRTTVEATPGAQDLDVQEIAQSGVKLAGALPRATPGMLHFVDSGIIDRLVDSEILGPAAVGEISGCPAASRAARRTTAPTRTASRARAPCSRPCATPTSPARWATCSPSPRPSAAS